MSSIELSPDTILVFDIEEMSDVIHTSTVLSYAASEDSVLIFKVQSNRPNRYNISPKVGVVHNNQTSLITLELESSNRGLVKFLYTVLAIIFWWTKL
jgi:hypothetical protein